MSAQPAIAVPHGVAGVLRDVVTLTKPRITGLVLCTTAGGLYLAPGAPPFWLLLFTLAGTALVVAGANTLNMYLERDVDALMSRTCQRPLPTQRLTPGTALGLGIGLGALGVPLLALAVNPLTGALGALALGLYVLAYTPLKRHSWTALVVGAVPGAIPPLLGWTAATGRLSWPGLVLFAVLFLWQVPHFVAISLFRNDDYARAGLHTLPGARGVGTAKRYAIYWVAALVPASLLLVPLGVAGHIYLLAALSLGAVFFGWTLWGLRATTGERWARSLFYVSLIYLTGLFLVLMADGGGT
ncbi:MAG TPA: heme o synthase [Polyangia bacterium]|nr:heme o synthase [Polyangia bacterium]